MRQINLPSLLMIGFWLFSSPAAMAQSDYQMLPPTFSGTNLPCTDITHGQVGLNQVLIFGGASGSGTSAINCLNGGFTVLPSGGPNGGYVGIGTSSPQAKLDIAGPARFGPAITGTACSVEGENAYDYEAHAPVYCDQSGTWQNQSLPAGIIAGACSEMAVAYTAGAFSEGATIGYCGATATYPAQVTGASPSCTIPPPANAPSGGPDVCGCVAGWIPVRLSQVTVSGATVAYAPVTTSCVKN